jgi:RNA polymerase sigma factor (sigma-70 family)
VLVTETYEDLRPLLFSIAYRMLGSVAEAEDIVQESFLRYHRALLEQDAEIDSAKAYLSAVATRLAIDHLRSARVRRESYVGEWLPEPLLTDETSPDAAKHAEDADSLSMAFLLLLERLSPVERAVFLLHDVFDYGYDEVAGLAARAWTTPANSPCEPAGTSTSSGRASRPRVRSGTGLPPASSTPSRTATWRGWSSCSPPMWPSTATAAARARHGGIRSSVATGSCGCCSGWDAILVNSG